MKFTIDTDDLKNKATAFAKKIAPDAAAVTTGAGVGAWLGSSIGIAALGTAIAGTVPVAVIGGAIALGVKKVWFSREPKVEQQPQA
jgi:hypothetical protein